MGFSLVFSLAISVSVSGFPVSFDFSVCVSELSLALARGAFLFSLRRRCKKSLPSEVSLSMFTSSSSVLSDSFWCFREIHSCVCPVSYKVVDRSLEERQSRYMDLRRTTWYRL